MADGADEDAQGHAGAQPHRQPSRRIARACAGSGLRKLNQTVEVPDTPANARHDRRGCLPGEVREELDDARNSFETHLEHPEYAAQRDQAGAGREAREEARRARLRLPRQDRGTRPQGPEVALRRLPQGRLRGRPDAAAAAAARSAASSPCTATTPRRCGSRTCRRCRRTPIDLAALKEAGVVPAVIAARQGDPGGRDQAQDRAEGPARLQGRPRGDRGGGRQRRVARGAGRSRRKRKAGAPSRGTSPRTRAPANGAAEG